MACMSIIAHFRLYLPLADSIFLSRGSLRVGRVENDRPGKLQANCIAGEMVLPRKHIVFNEAKQSQ